MKKVAPYGITPPCRAMPLRIAPIPCSRTPKWRVLPPGGASGRNSPASLLIVSVEGAGAADPPPPPPRQSPPHPPSAEGRGKRNRGGLRGELRPPLLLRPLPARQRLPEM